jgi:hypothetical protein
MATAAAVYSDNGRDGDCRTRGLYCLGSEAAALGRESTRTAHNPQTAHRANAQAASRRVETLHGA